jgi:hypothetical protein
LRRILLGFALLMTVAYPASSEGDPCAGPDALSTSLFVLHTRKPDLFTRNRDYASALMGLIGAESDLYYARVPDMYSQLQPQRHDAEAARNTALRAAGLSKEFALAQENLERTCVEVEAIRLNRLLKDAEARRVETARLRKLADDLLAEDVEIANARGRQKYVAETERIVADGEQPSRALADLKSKLAQATLLLKTLQRR